MVALVRPHSWQDCRPIVVNPNNECDPDDPANIAVRKVFKKLSQADRVKFHQFTCLNYRSHAHLAVMLKIDKLLYQEDPTFTPVTDRTPVDRVVPLKTAPRIVRK